MSVRDTWVVSDEITTRPARIRTCDRFIVSKRQIHLGTRKCPSVRIFASDWVNAIFWWNEAPIKNDCFYLYVYWDWVTQICVSKLAVIGSDNGLSPDRCQAIIRTNAGIMLIGPLGTKFSEIITGIYISLKKMYLKMWSGNMRPFCLGLNVFYQNGLWREH